MKEWKIVVVKMFFKIYMSTGDNMTPVKRATDILLTIQIKKSTKEPLLWTFGGSGGIRTHDTRRYT